MELSARIYRTAGALAYSMASPEIAPDCQQEALLRAVRAVRRIDPAITQGHAYIERHMQGAIKDYLRRDRRARPAACLPLDIGAYRVPDRAPSPEFLAVIRERMRQRRKAKHRGKIAPPWISREEWLQEGRR